MQVWTIAPRRCLMAVAVTEIVDYPLVSALRIVLLAGHGMDAWQQDLLERLESFAVLHGASRLEAYGRKGFIRALKPLGFELAYYAVMKEIAR